MFLTPRPLQVRPHGAIFIDHFASNETEDSTQLGYTMVAQELALYGFQDHFVNGTINNQVHRR